MLGYHAHTNANKIAKGEWKLTLLVQGKDIQPRSYNFVLVVNDEDKLEFYRV